LTGLVLLTVASAKDSEAGAKPADLPQNVQTAKKAYQKALLSAENEFERTVEAAMKRRDEAMALATNRYLTVLDAGLKIASRNGETDPLVVTYKAEKAAVLAGGRVKDSIPGEPVSLFADQESFRKYFSCGEKVKVNYIAAKKAVEIDRTSRYYSGHLLLSREGKWKSLSLTVPVMAGSLHVIINGSLFTCEKLTGAKVDTLARLVFEYDAENKRVTMKAGDRVVDHADILDKPDFDSNLEVRFDRYGSKFYIQEPEVIPAE
jgi:hypothetical protein